jgi:hypothetical protein
LKNSLSTNVGCEQQLKFSAKKNSFIFNHGWSLSSNHEQQHFDPTVNSSRDIKFQHPWLSLVFIEGEDWCGY